MSVALLLSRNIEEKAIQKLLYNCYVIQQEKMAEQNSPASIPRQI